MQLTLGTAPGCLAGKLEAIAASLEGLQESLIFGLFFFFFIKAVLRERFRNTYFWLECPMYCVSF